MDIFPIKFRRTSASKVQFPHVRILLLIVLLTLSAVAEQRVVERMVVHYGDKEEVRSLLATLVPEVEFVVQGDFVVLAGPSKSVGLAKELLEQLDIPVSRVHYCLNLFTLGAENLKQFRAFWNSPQFGIVYRSCFGTSDVYLRWFLHQGEATMLASPTLLGNLDQECGLELREEHPKQGAFGLRATFEGRLEDGDRIDMTVALSEQWPTSDQKLQTRVTLRDGDSLLVRGLLPDRNPPSMAGLAELPIWGPLFRPAQKEREVLLMITPYLAR